MIKAPEVVEKTWSGNDKVSEYSHDAFGIIGVANVTGGGVLFGSDLNHGQHIRISIKRAKMVRGLSNDWYHADSSIVEVSLSHTQYADLITNPNRGDGVPCTINYAPEKGTGVKRMPNIERIESKAETLRNEIRNSAKEQTIKIMEAFKEIEALVESGTMSKKAMKAALFSMKCQIENTPSNMAYVVEQSEEAMEKIVSAAKTEVEAYCHNKAVQLGYASIAEAAKNGLPMLT